MKKLYILTLFLSLFGIYQGETQCTNSVIDWDYREFFARNSNTIRTYISLAESQTQYFALGTNRMTFTHNYTTNNTIVGDNTTHTGETGSYGTGADVQFIGNGTLGLSFQTSVTNLKFSLYDIDRNQIVSITASDGATPRTVTMARVTSSILSVVGSGTVLAIGSANSGTANNNSNDGTLNIDIAGPVTTVTIVISNTGTNGSEGGEYWVSDITACSAGSYPNNYYNVSQPFTGMPAYVVVVRNNIFYYMDPATGNAKYLFQDNTNNNMNSVAYDPYNRYVYYTYSLSGVNGFGNPAINPNEKALRRYDVNMDTFGVVLNDVNALGIPTFGQGVESGAAAYYDSRLYFGVEGHSSTAVESIIWRVDLNAAHFPVSFSQVYAQPSYDGSDRLHDWADFGLNNGVLYDFDGGVANSPTGQNTNFFTQNLLTGAVNAYTPVSLPLIIPRQTCVDWQGNVYNMGSAGGASDIGTVGLYNLTNNVGATNNISEKGVTFVGGSWGDGSEAFRPLVDFGDAPATYDPVSLSAAINERDTALRLGTQLSVEWLTRGQTPAANSDNFDDGVATVRIFSNLYSTYYNRVVVHNNTGANATVMGWLDWNGNGVFDAGEASAAVTVPTSGTNQTVNLNWTGISSTLTTGATTYMRIRLTSAVNTLTSAKATGWLDDGETEDYPVIVNNIVLPVELLNFDAKTVNNSSVKLSWSAAEEGSVNGYELQRSHNGTEWERIAFIPSNGRNGIQYYESIDEKPYKGNSKYRLKMIDGGSRVKYSEIRTVKITDLQKFFTITPNPASSNATLNIPGDMSGEIAQIRVIDSRGNELYYKKTRLSMGVNSIDLPLNPSWPIGTYIVLVTTDAGTVNNKLIIKR